MNSDLKEVRAKILTLQWDAEKKGKASAYLSHDAVNKLHGLDDVDVFEATLETLLAQGIAVFGAPLESRITQAIYNHQALASRSACRCRSLVPGGCLWLLPKRHRLCCFCWMFVAAAL